MIYTGTAARAAVTEARVKVETLEHVLTVLTCALGSGDMVTARYACTTIIDLSRQVETALIAPGTEACRV